MATPFLYLLPPAARAIYPYVVAGVRRGLSSRAIEQSIRQAGLSVSRGRTILPLMSKLKVIEQQGQNIRFVAKANTINVNKLPESITRLRREFSYTVRINGTAPDGSVIERYMTISTDRANLTPGDIESMAEDMVNQAGGNYALQDVSARLQSGVRSSSNLPPLSQL